MQSYCFNVLYPQAALRIRARSRIAVVWVISASWPSFRQDCMADELHLKEFRNECPKGLAMKHLIVVTPLVLLLPSVGISQATTFTSRSEPTQAGTAGILRKGFSTSSTPDQFVP